MNSIRATSLISSILLLLSSSSCLKSGGGGGGAAASSGSTSSSNTLYITTPASSPTKSNASILQILGKCVANTTVSLIGSLVAGDVTLPAGSLSTTCTSSGDFEFRIQKTTDGYYGLIFRQTADTDTAVMIWQRDTTAPSAPVRTSPVSNPYSSSETSFSLRGNCENGATVTLSGDQTGTTTCVNSKFSFTISESTVATFNYSVTQTDAAGNTSSAMTFQWVRSAAGLNPPVITSPTDNPSINNLSTMTLSGTCTAGITVKMTGAETQSMACTGGGTFSFTLNQTVDATHTYQLVQYDAGPPEESSSAVTFTWIRDTVDPAPVIVTVPAQNPKYTAGDSLTIAGTCEANATVRMTGSDTQNTTCTAGGAFSFDVTKTSNGTYTFTLDQVDAATNDSSDVTFTWVRDATIPSTPVILNPATDPYYSNTTPLSINGTCTDGYEVYITGDDTQNVTCSSSSFSFSVAAGGEGTYNYYVRQENLAGTASGSEQQTWVYDTTAPANPTITIPITSPWTSASDLTLSGACEAFATVVLSGDDSQTTTCAAGGTYGFTVSESADGTYNYTVSQTDRAGNTSAGSVSIQYVKDTTVPSDPVITSPIATTVTNTANSFTISGTCVNGLTIQLSGDVIAGDVTNPAGSLTQTCVSSAFTFVIAKAVDDTYDFNLVQKNGVLTSGTVTRTWIRDTAAPTATINTNPTDPNLRIISTFTFSSNEGGSTFECRLDAGSWGTCASPVTYSALSNASHTFDVRATDGAGNVSAVDSYTWTQAAYQAVAIFPLNVGAPLSDISSYSGADDNDLTVDSTTASATGKYSEGRNFDGTDVMSAPDSSTLGILDTKMTVEFWMNTNSNPINGGWYIIGQSDSNPNFSWDVRIKKQGVNYRVQFWASSSGSPPGSVTVESANLTGFSSGTWHHYAITFDAGSVNMYFDGTNVKTQATGIASLYNSSALFRIGKSSAGLAITGADAIIDDVRISQTIRYSSNFTPPASAHTAD